MITITDKAKNKLLSLMKEANYDNSYALRLGIDSGGCSGLSYKMDFSNEIQPEDQVFENTGVKVVVDKKSFLYLTGLELDFSDGLNGKGFQFINPNATKTCHCGESFAV